MKKILAVMLIIGVMIGFTGCGEKTETNKVINAPSMEVEGVFLGEVLSVEDKLVELKLQEQEDIEELEEVIFAQIRSQHKAEVGQKYTVAYINKKEIDGNIVVEAVMFEKEQEVKSDGVEIEVKKLTNKDK